MAQSNSFITFIIALIALLFAFVVMLYAWGAIAKYLSEKNLSPFATLMITFVIFFAIIFIGYYVYFKMIDKNYNVWMMENSYQRYIL